MAKVAQKIVLDGEEVSISGGSSVLIPSGVIWPWYHTEEQAVPDGWALCDGENGTPDLRGRFLLGASDDHIMGETGGSEEVTLTVEQMPEHNHKFYIGASSASSSAIVVGPKSLQPIQNEPTGKTGSSEPHPNMPPYFTVDYIMKL